MLNLILANLMDFQVQCNSNFFIGFCALNSQPQKIVVIVFISTFKSL